jgi:sortase (surface protein transpeptidase)
VKYADDLVLLAKEEMVLYSMTDRLIRIEDAMEKNECGKKNQVMRITKQPYPVKIMTD